MLPALYGFHHVSNAGDYLITTLNMQYCTHMLKYMWCVYLCMVHVYVAQVCMCVCMGMLHACVCVCVGGGVVGGNSET